MKNLTTILVLFVALLAGGCATSLKQNVYQSGATQQQMKVQLATVVDVRDVDIEVNPSGGGTLAGAAIGGTAGMGVPGTRQGVVGSIAGAVVGGIAGTLAEKGLNAKKGQEVIYKIDDTPGTFALVQELDGDPLHPGDRVRLMSGSFASRLVKIAATK